MSKVAIIGRPNVGKSTLFNKFCRTRRAIVADIPGITRDRLYGRVEHQGRRFEVIDTGGVVPGDPDQIRGRIIEQASQAIREADLILFIVNGREGLTPLDEEVGKLLRSHSSRVAVLVNQIDHPGLEAEAGVFHKLGMDQVFSISAEHGRGLIEVLDYVVARLGIGIADSSEESDAEKTPEVRIAIVGRPNVGKSTLLNRLVGEERAIVSPVPGTTRDAVDSVVRRGKRDFRFIDTAGIRRRGQTSKQIESLSVIMAQKSLKSADVALLIMDASEGVVKLDADIAGMAAESGCSVILLLNKWDLLANQREVSEKRLQDIRRRVKFLSFAPVLTISALTGTRVESLYQEVVRASEARLLRISTARLNREFLPRVKDYLLNSGRFEGLEVNFMTQVGIAPPTFVLFVKGRSRLHFSLERYLENQLREVFSFHATPIRLVQRTRRSTKRS